MIEYSSGKKYTRKEIMAALGVSDTGGGAWYTGYVRHNDEHYIFCNVQAEGRTGQNYNNYFEEDELIWHTRKGAKISKGVAARLISNTSRVHIFYREDNRMHFSYLGPAIALSWSERESVEIRWGFGRTIFFPDDIQSDSAVLEGAKRQVIINAYERDSTARQRCIQKWGHSCVVCAFNFEQRYGDYGRGYIHVHHLVPIATIGEEYKLDPENDLRPVCPNCHAMLHRSKNVLSISELKNLLR